jgi:hypothetical protein
MYLNAYLNGCCNGGWGAASSTDGIHFSYVRTQTIGFPLINLGVVLSQVSLNETGAYAVVDGNGLFVDDDGTAYNIYTSEDQDHRVSIELLTPDYLHIAGTNYGLFPEHYVEGAILFKRNSIYYVMYGSCCW